MRRAFVLVPLVAFACSEGGPRFVSTLGHYSLLELQDWSRKEELGAVVWVSDRVSIGIKAVQPSEKRPSDEVIAATATFLGSLPGAKVSPPRPRRVNGFSAASFDLTFHPEDRKESYQRRHTVLMAKGGRVFHLFVTAPTALAEGDITTFERVVDSLKEEG